MYVEFLPEHLNTLYQHKCVHPTDRFVHRRYDHLEGRLFVDRVDAKSLEKIRGKLAAMEDGFAAASPGVAIQRIDPPKA